MFINVNDKGEYYWSSGNYRNHWKQKKWLVTIVDQNENEETFYVLNYKPDVAKEIAVEVIRTYYGRTGYILKSVEEDKK